MTTSSPPAPDQIPIEEQYPGLRRVGVRPGFLEYARQAWDRRDFAYTIALGQLRAENQNTVLGGVWHLLNPLMLAGVYYLVFGVVLGGRAAVHENYAAFLIVGIFVFHFSQKVILGGTRVMVNNIDLIRNVRFPRALLPIASTIQETLAQLPALGAMGVIVFFTEWLRLSGAAAAGDIPSYTLAAWPGGEHVILSGWWLLVIPLVVVQSVFNLGAALLVARLTFHFRDTEFILSYVMRLLFYSSGVFFGVELVARMIGDAGAAGRLAVWLFQANPFYGFIRLTREAVMDGGGTDPWFWSSIGIWTLGALVIGFLVFRHKEHEYSHA